MLNKSWQEAKKLGMVLVFLVLCRPRKKFLYAQMGLLYPKATAWLFTHCQPLWEGYWGWMDAYHEMDSHESPKTRHYWTGFRRGQLDKALKGKPC